MHFDSNGTYPLQHYPEMATNQTIDVTVNDVTHVPGLNCESSAAGTNCLMEAMKNNERRHSQPCPRIEVHAETPAQCETPLNHMNNPPLRKLAKLNKVLAEF